MKDRGYNSGFTIIEVVLFMAISGLMIAGLLVGVSGSVNRERYNDAVTSLYDFMQGQYNLIDNVNTNRLADFRCSPAGIVVDSVDGQPRGTSDCTIIGRLVTSQDGIKLVSEPIYATVDIKTALGTVVGNPSEADLLDALGLKVSAVDLPDDRQQYTVAWETSLYLNANVSDKQFSLALIRLPTNNLVRSFVIDSYSTDVDNIVDNATTASTAFCIVPDGMVSSPPLGVKLQSVAANANSVQRTTGSSGDC